MSNGKTHIETKRNQKLTDETNPEEFRRVKPKGHDHIKGWGIDADPENDPTYPIKNRTNEEHEGYSWERPSLQPVNDEILKSVERPNITATFGTSVPPKGLSGMLRRFAFKYSESSYGRWLPLIMADRIGVYEGIFSDFARGYFPNFWKERGWNADWKYDSNRAYRKIGAYAIIAAGVTFWVLTRRKKGN